MRNNILAIVIFYAFVSTIFGCYVIVMQDDIIDARGLDLNVSQTAFMIQTANVKLLSHRVAELKTANMCLLRVMDKPHSIKAIKDTPLPKLIKEHK